AVLLALLLATGTVAVRALHAPVAAAEALTRWIARTPQFLRRRLERHAWIEDARALEKAGGLKLLTPATVAICVVAELGYLAADGFTLWALFRGVGSGMSLGRSLFGFVFAQLVALAVVIPGTLEVGMAGILTGFGARAGT